MKAKMFESSCHHFQNTNSFATHYFYPIDSRCSQLDCRICNRMLQSQTKKKTVWLNSRLLPYLPPPPISVVENGSGYEHNWIKGGGGAREVSFNVTKQFTWGYTATFKQSNCFFNFFSIVLDCSWCLSKYFVMYLHRIGKIKHRARGKTLIWE